MTSTLLPPRGAWVETSLLYNRDFPEKAGWFYAQLKGLAWQGGGKTTPWISMIELTELIGRHKTAIYGYMTALRTINALRWRTSGDGHFMFSFPLAENSAFTEMPDSSSGNKSPMAIDSLEEQDGLGFRKCGNVFEVYQSNIGLLTPMISDALKDAEKTYTTAWVIDAIQEAVLNNARSWKYCEAILKRWNRDGFKAPKPAARGKTTAEERQAVTMANIAKGLGLDGK